MKKRFYHYKGYVIKKMLIGIMIIASHHYLKPNELKEVLKKDTVLIIIQNKMIIGSIRAHISNRTCYIGRVIVHPLHQNKGVGSILINEIENIFNSIDRFELFTGFKDEKNYIFIKSMDTKNLKKKQLMAA